MNDSPLSADFSRRRFLRWTGVAGAGAFAAGATTISAADVVQAAQTNPLAAGTPILVLCTLYGGNDGLSTVVPYTDDTYFAARPDLALQPSQVADLGDGLGLNLALGELMPWWEQGSMAIVRGVGYPEPDHSHFTSMAIWQTASRDASHRTGWLGRWLDTQPEDPMTAINVGSTLPPVLIGATTAGSSIPDQGFSAPQGVFADQCHLLTGTVTPTARQKFINDWDLANIHKKHVWIPTWRSTHPRLTGETWSAYVARGDAAYAQYVAEKTEERGSAVARWERSHQLAPASSLRATAAQSMGNLFHLRDYTQAAISAAAVSPEIEDIERTQVGALAGGETALDRQLNLVASLIEAGAPTRVWSTTLGGFDTHADEISAQTALLGIVGGAIARFLQRMAASNVGSPITVVVYSEFGRRVAANASQGTDHGTAGPVFVIGPQVRGGFYGDQPSLASLNRGDLFVTTDFRDIYSAISTSILHTDPARLLSGWSGSLPLFR